MTPAPVRQVGRGWLAGVLGIAVLQSIPAAPTHVEALGQLLSVHEGNAEVPINCSNAVMTTAPAFLAAPKGAAKYPFSMRCTSPARPGVMTFTWEGSWTPSETRRDRPNASESLTITGYEPFLPDRAPGGKIFMYWTGNCTADPWLQDGTCSRFGEYMPDDLKAAFPNIGTRPFPLTGRRISPALKQQLINQYQAANQPASQRSRMQNMTAQTQQSQVITQSQRLQAMTVPPQTTLPKSNTAASNLARSGIFARGVEGKEDQTSGHQPNETQAERAETSDAAVLEEGAPEIIQPIVLTIDRPLHVTTAAGASAVLTPGTYDVQPVLDVQIGLAREGQPTVLLHARRSGHSESLQHPLAMGVPGESEQVHLILLIPDGRRFDAQASRSETGRGINLATTVPDKTLQEAIRSASTQSRGVLPACRPNLADIGPRWIPVPCTVPLASAP